MVAFPIMRKHRMAGNAIFFCVIQSFRRVIDGGCKPRSDKDEKRDVI